MRTAAPRVIPRILATVLALLTSAAPAGAASSLPALAGLEPPATEGTAASYPGAVAVRSMAEGYVIAVEGAWGSATLVFEALGAVPQLAASDPRGKVLLREGEVMVVLPGSGDALRLTLPTPAAEPPVPLEPPQIERLHALQGTVELVEVEGSSLVSYHPALAGLGTEDLLAAENLAAVVAARLGPADGGLQVLTGNAFNPTPPDDGGGSGCSTSCSVTCPPNNNSCSGTSGGWACCTCSCNQGAASCRCR